MKRMRSSDSKAECLAVIDEVGESGERVVISKRGKPVAELIRGSAHVIGDMIGSAVEPETLRSIES